MFMCWSREHSQLAWYPQVGCGVFQVNGNDLKECEITLITMDQEITRPLCNHVEHRQKHELYLDQKYHTPQILVWVTAIFSNQSHCLSCLLVKNYEDIQSWNYFYFLTLSDIEQNFTSLDPCHKHLL